MKFLTKTTLPVWLALLAALGGCTGLSVAGNPVQTYSGPSRPTDRVALFDCGFGVAVKAIDGNAKYKGNPLTCKFALLPGRHRFRVGFTSEKGATDGRVSSRHDYVVTLDLVAGRKYTLNAFLKDDRNAAMPWKVNLADSSEKYLVDVKNVREVR